MPNGERFAERVAIRCMFANTFSAARRSMNIRALTVGGGVSEAAQRDLFAHTVLAVLLQRGGNLSANDRGGCNGCKIAIANVLARHPAHVLFMRCPDHFVCVHSTLTDLPCCFFCSNRTGYRGPRQWTAETAAETLLERNLPNLICSGGGNPLQNFIWHFWSRN